MMNPQRHVGGAPKGMDDADASARHLCRRLYRTTRSAFRVELRGGLAPPRGRPPNFFQRRFSSEAALRTPR
jgi:hypothetical protein